MIRNANQRPRGIAVVLLGLTCQLLLACGGDDAPVSPDAGSPSRRIASLYPVATETLFALGAGDRVIARSRWCDYPPEVADRPALGDATGVSAEKILTLGPDLVLVGSRIQEEALAPLSTRMRIERATVDDVAGVLRLLAKLGRLTGTDASAEVLSSTIRQALQSARTGAAGLDPVTFVFVVQREPLIVAGTTSYVGELLAALGGENIAAGVPGQWPTLSLETLIKAEPAVILDGAMTESEEFWDRFLVISGRVVRVTESVVLRPGPRLPEALTVLEGHLRGEGR